jgi:CDP-diacylglycerol--glycerol-3-phosphate 3-phosphatidyltransferase
MADTGPRTSAAGSGAEDSPSDRVLTIPNLLSVTRILGAPLFLWLILRRDSDGLALVVLMVSGVTDYLDGKLARRWNQTSRLGQLLDPAADRLYIIATVIGLTMRDIIPLWLVLALVARDVMLFGCVPVLRRLGYGPALPVHYLGKAATFNLLYAFPFLLLADGDGALSATQTLASVFGWAFVLWGSTLYWWAGIVYLIQVSRLAADGRATPTPRTA